eukprot:CAMPEP_0182418040 /NCGR_PEP_ID=MMETSP1167-20130531/2499_1 /TAXON_ID=2988 /ORGANISM="Mallomonas Sp, Strain CCMP3275" /LENGTH=576 /DNA_ID=CAMNT_0024592005 /DNA_START=81 /DNA_END=1811 /DNA_ORIENTATION=-
MSESEPDSSGGTAGEKVAESTNSDIDLSNGGNKRKKSPSDENVDGKLQRCRERNRFHARNTRERKKNQIEMMLSRIEKLNEERAALSAQVVDTTVADILMTLSSQEQKTSEDSLNGLEENSLDGKNSNKIKKENSNMKSLDQICAHVMKELVDESNEEIKADLELLNKDKSACTSEELDTIRRERNRLHAKKTRLRKKLMLQEMETNLLKLEDEVLNLRKKKDNEQHCLQGIETGGVNGNMIMSNGQSSLMPIPGYRNPVMSTKYPDAKSVPGYYDTEEYGVGNMKNVPQYVTIAVPYGMMYNCSPYDAPMNGPEMPYHPLQMPPNAHMMGAGGMGYVRANIPPLPVDYNDDKSSQASQTSNKSHTKSPSVTSQPSAHPISNHAVVPHPHKPHLPPHIEQHSQHSHSQHSHAHGHGPMPMPMSMPSHPMSMQMAQSYMWPPYQMGMKAGSAHFMSGEVPTSQPMPSEWPGAPYPGHYMMPPAGPSLMPGPSPDYYVKNSFSDDLEKGRTIDENGMSASCYSNGSASSNSSSKGPHGKHAENKHGRERRIYSHHTESVEKDLFPDQNTNGRHGDVKT